jgi:hypothetical protein
LFNAKTKDNEKGGKKIDKENTNATTLKRNESLKTNKEKASNITNSVQGVEPERPPVKVKKGASKLQVEEEKDNVNPENVTVNNKKTKGPSAKDYFNTDMKNGILESEFSEQKAKPSTKGTYEQYSKLVESLVMHKVLVEQ